MPIVGDSISTECSSVIGSGRILRVARPAMRVGLGPGQAERLHQLVKVSSEGQTIGEYRFTKSGFQTISWRMPSGIQNAKDFEIDVGPEFRQAPGTDALGVMVCACGFLEERGK